MPSSVIVSVPAVFLLSSCTNKSQVIASLGQYSVPIAAAFVAIRGLGDFSKQVCNVIVNGKDYDGEDKRICDRLGTGVASGLTGAFSVAIAVKFRNGVVATRSGENHFLQELHIRQAYEDRGLVFEGLDVLQILDGRSVDGGPPVTKFSVRGVSLPGEDDIRTDHHVTMFPDGKGHIFTAPSQSDHDSSRPLTKRHDGPGFKINWDSFDVNGNFLGEPDTSPFVELSQKISQDWANRVADQPVNEYIGSAHLEGIVNVGFRIIPETAGYGEEYEDVNICVPIEWSDTETK